MPFSRRPFTGFPFDDNQETRNRSFESELEDIANRHPNFAEHIRPFTRTTGASSSQDRFGANRRRFDEPFNSRLRDFGFPFGPDEDFDQNLYYPQERPPHPYHHQEAKCPDTSVNAERDSRQFTPKIDPKPKSNIQQSNTVDLGQKQEPVDDNRHQRSMSAPPENPASSGRRFVSSINIPNINAGVSDMGSKMSQPETNQQQQNKPKERIIPIHIEGRDEPVIPKNPNISFSGPPPQTERIFGQRPSAFTQFVNKEEPQVHQFQQPSQHQHQFEPAREQPQPKKKEEVQQEQDHVDGSQASAPPPPPPIHKPTPLEIIQNIQRDVSDLMNQVENFNGKPKDKQYIYLDEMLTRNLIKLDNVDTEGKDAIRQARREAIKCIEECIRVLETKANSNESVKTSEENPGEVKMETESHERESGNESSNTQTEASNKKNENETATTKTEDPVAEIKEATPPVTETKGAPENAEAQNNIKE